MKELERFVSSEWMRDLTCIKGTENSPQESDLADVLKPLLEKGCLWLARRATLENQRYGGGGGGGGESEIGIEWGKKTPNTCKPKRKKKA